MTFTKRTYVPPLIIYITSLPIWIYASGLKEGLLEWIIFSSIIALPAFIALLFGETDKTKAQIYMGINFLVFLTIVILDLTSDCTGMCFKGVLSVGGLLYWGITYLAFRIYLRKTDTKK